MSRLTYNENREISRLLNHQVIKEVTKTMNNINFIGFERKVKEMIISFLEKPIKQITHSEGILSKMSETVRRNVRRVHELEFVMEKYQRAATIVETFENRFTAMQGSMDSHGAIYADAIAVMRKQVEEQLPETIGELQKEMNSWKRLSDRTDKEVANIQECQKKDTSTIMKAVKRNHKTCVTEIQELKQRIEKLDGTLQVTNGKLEVFSESVSDVRM